MSTRHRRLLKCTRLALGFLLWCAMAPAPCSAAECKPPEIPSTLASSVEWKSGERALEPFWLRTIGFSSPLAFVESLTLHCFNKQLALSEFPDMSAIREIDPCHLDASDPVPARAPGSVEIEVYFHVLTTSDGEGLVSESAVRKQIDVLNDAFAGKGPGGNGVPTPFRFRLVEMDCTIQDDWFNMQSGESPTQAERDAKDYLNKGDKSVLNIYTARVDGPYGWARWPWNYADKVDGVVVRYSTLPGGLTPFYDEGDVTTHEVGHWLGLFHTFENGCNAPGDCVDDTTFEKYRGRFCRGDNSCPSSGRDPITNYMDCTWDSCVCEFTLEQIKRMDAIHFKYRRR